MDYKHDSAFKKRTDDINRMRISYGKIEKMVREEHELKKIYDSKNFSKSLFDKGITWFESGLSLDEADERLRNDRSFVNGFNYGYRLSLVKELEATIKKK